VNDYPNLKLMLRSGKFYTMAGSRAELVEILDEVSTLRTEKLLLRQEVSVLERSKKATLAELEGLRAEVTRLREAYRATVKDAGKARTLIALGKSSEAFDLLRAAAHHPESRGHGPIYP
jgi:chromosome segregation ATPase